jgi:hypothetical protein
LASYAAHDAAVAASGTIPAEIDPSRFVVQVSVDGDDDQQRYSKRTRYAPLQFWRGERLTYARDHTAPAEVVSKLQRASSVEPDVSSENGGKKLKLPVGAILPVPVYKAEAFPSVVVCLNIV